MATISFQMKNEAAAPSTITYSPEQVNKEVAIIDEKPLATQTTPPPAGIEGEITANDIKPPRLNLTQKSGKLSDEFTVGSFVYDKTFEIVGPGQELAVTVLRFRKYYQQKLPYGSDDLPKRFDRAEEVRQAGGTTRWSLEAVKALEYYGETADILLAIEAPKSLDEEKVQTFFPYSHSGQSYGLLIYTFTSSAFTSFGRRVITDATMLLRDGLHTGQYKIKSVKQTSPENTWFVPVASFDKKHTPEAAEFFRAIAGL